jgi:hypothetical protein
MPHRLPLIAASHTRWVARSAQERNQDVKQISTYPKGETYASAAFLISCLPQCVEGLAVVDGYAPPVLVIEAAPRIPLLRRS